MEIITQVTKQIQDILTTEADRIAGETDLVKRQRKFTGVTFIQTLVFGWLSKSEATLDELTDTAAVLGINITSQALDQRFNQIAATFLKGVLESSVCEVIRGEKSSLDILRRFSGIYLMDSSTVVLPDELAKVSQGCGGSSSKNTSSSLKLQVKWELLTGGLCLELTEGRESDNSSTFQQEKLPPSSLRIADLGYFNLDVFEKIDEEGGYWLSRVKSGCVLYVKEDDTYQRYELAEYLTKQEENAVEVEILLGAKAKLPCRLIAARVPQEVASERRRKLKQRAKKKGRTPSKRQLELCDWIILATNAGYELISFDEAFVLARMRWQIELLFKLWKSHGKISRWRSEKPWRILCEVYAKLIGMIIQNWVLLATGWRFGKKSLTKAARIVRKHIVRITCAFGLDNSERESAIKSIFFTIRQCIEFGCKMETRKKNPSSYQLLLGLEQIA